MFGFRNFTGAAFISKIGNFSIEFAFGVLEEVSLNITGSTAANAVDIPENFDLNLLGRDPIKDPMIKTACVAVSSKILTSNLINLIAGATPNLFI